MGGRCDGPGSGRTVEGMQRFRYVAAVAAVCVVLIGAMWWFMRSTRLDLPEIVPETVPAAPPATTTTTNPQRQVDAVTDRVIVVLSTPTDRHAGTFQDVLEAEFGAAAVEGAFDGAGRPTGPTSLNVDGGWCVVWQIDEAANPTGFTIDDGECRPELVDDDPDNDAPTTTEGGLLVPGG